MTRTKLAFGPPEVVVERRPDGVMLARSPHPLGSYPRVATDWLDGKHTIFGQVKSGQDIVNAIAQGDRLVSVLVEEK